MTMSVNKLEKKNTKKSTKRSMENMKVNIRLKNRKQIMRKTIMRLRKRNRGITLRIIGRPIMFAGHTTTFL